MHVRQPNVLRHLLPLQRTGHWVTVYIDDCHWKANMMLQLPGAAVVIMNHGHLPLECFAKMHLRWLMYCSAGQQSRHCLQQESAPAIGLVIGLCYSVSLISLLPKV